MTEEMKELKLEEAMCRLDAVVAALDREGVDLEESLKLYEEGVRLVAICQKKLNDAERIVQTLKINSDGEMCEEPFDVRVSQA